jgi:hypothetical protein
VTESREAGQAAAGEITSAATGCVDWASEAGKVRGCAYQDTSSPSICRVFRVREGFCVLWLRGRRGRFDAWNVDSDV